MPGHLDLSRQASTDPARLSSQPSRHTTVVVASLLGLALALVVLGLGARRAEADFEQRHWEGTAATVHHLIEGQMSRLDLAATEELVTAYGANPDIVHIRVTDAEGATLVEAGDPEGEGVDHTVVGPMTELSLRRRSRPSWGLPPTPLALLSTVPLVAIAALLLANRSRQANDEIRQRLQVVEQAQVALTRSERLNAIGQLTAGLAHDFNNLLFIIRSSLELHRRRHRSDPPDRHVKIASDATERAIDVTRKLQVFARQSPLQPVSTDLGQLVRDLEPTLRQLLSPLIDLEVDVADQAHQALVDPAEFESALVNLCDNADDAMPGGGRVTASCSTVELVEPRTMVDGTELGAGAWHVVAVADTGTGIAPGVVNRMFEPFFTSKDPSEGTVGGVGLGLSMVLGYCSQSGGGVDVITGAQGTTFEMFFPPCEPVGVEESGSP